MMRKDFYGDTKDTNSGIVWKY